MAIPLPYPFHTPVMPYVWLKSGYQNDLMNMASDLKDNPSEQATCAVVGAVSPSHLFLEPHGNFNPMFENAALEASKAQFQIVSPIVHPEFSDDLKLALEHIERLQKKAITEGPNREHFVVTDGQANIRKNPIC